MAHHRTLTALFVAAALWLLPGHARALEMGLELEIGTGLALGAFPDGVPISIEDPDGNLFLGIPDSSYNVLADLKPGLAFSAGLSLLLGNWYLRTAFSVQSISEVELTRYAVRRIAGVDLDPIIQNLYIGEVDQAGDPDEGITLITTRFGFGHRWYLSGEGLLRPYIPMGAGALLAVVDGESQFGLSFHAGVGCDIHLALHLDLGIRVLYEWMGVFQNDNFQPKSAGSAVGAAVTSGNSVLEAFMESLHTVQFSLGLTYRF